MESFTFNYAVRMQPLPKKRSPNGDDAYFVSVANRTVGVFDGVGGWGEIEGGNAAEYSQRLSESAQNFSGCQHGDEVIDNAFRVVGTSIRGSTTVALAKIVDAGLEFFILGDSLCGQLRDNRMIFKTEPLLHGWNFPFQLGMNSRDTPKSGTTDFVDIRNRDLIICASDGLWDNLFDKEIEAIAENSKDLEEFADNLITHAKSRQNNENECISPFSFVQNGYSPVKECGKPDDTTIVVLEIVSNKTDEL